MDYSVSVWHQPYGAGLLTCFIRSETILDKAFVGKKRMALIAGYLSAPKGFRVSARFLSTLCLHFLRFDD
jgi:hypothetical protein